MGEIAGHSYLRGTNTVKMLPSNVYMMLMKLIIIRKILPCINNTNLIEIRFDGRRILFSDKKQVADVATAAVYITHRSKGRLILGT